jgi:glycosyltransferase involved in cell wall biosynthesis
LFLANFFNYPSGQTGVYRTVEELLFELCKRNDVELTAMAICGEDPLTDATNASRYVANHKDLLGCNFDPELKGRFGLSRVYLRTFGDNSKAAGTASASAAQSRYYQKAKPLFTRVVRKMEHPRPAFKRDRYDVFHSPFFKLPSKEVVGDIPRIQTVFDLICQRQPEWMPPDVVKLAYDILDSIDVDRDWVTCISEFTKQELCDFTGMAPGRVFVTPLAAANHFRPVSDPERISAARLKYGIPEGDYWLALGALQPRKNFIHLIHSFLRLVSEQPNLNVNLIIVGATAWMFDEIFSAIGTSTKLRHRIHFAGFVSDEDLSAVYSGATAFLFPSLYEGFGLPALEAMQCGTPVIASNTTALPEVVGDAGLLVNPQDSDALCQAMLELLTNSELRRQLSQKGLMRSKKFSWAKCAEKTVDAYRIAAGSN